jgi:hypothetical protein
VIGNDIDPDMVVKVREMLQKEVCQSDKVCQYRGVIEGDFLQTTREMFAVPPSLSDKTTSEVSPCCRVEHHQQQQQTAMDGHASRRQGRGVGGGRLVVVGGPPYTLGGGTGQLNRPGRGQNLTPSDSSRGGGGGGEGGGGGGGGGERGGGVMCGDSGSGSGHFSDDGDDGDDGDDDGRELPLQFLVHACSVLKADR